MTFERFWTRHATIAAFGAFAIATALAAPARAQDASPDEAESGVRRDFVLDLPAGPPVTGDQLSRATEEIADRIRCPQCQGLSVADSPSNTAQAMKAEVRDMIAEGYSEEQILSYFEASYGEFIRLEPKAEGFNMVVWLAPFAIFAFGVAAVALRLRANAAALEAESVDDTPDADELDAYRERVRQELSS